MFGSAPSQSQSMHPRRRSLCYLFWPDPAPEQVEETVLLGCVWSTVVYLQRTHTQLFLRKPQLLRSFSFGKISAASVRTYTPPTEKLRQSLTGALFLASHFPLLHQLSCHSVPRNSEFGSNRHTERLPIDGSSFVLKFESTKKRFVDMDEFEGG